MAQLDSLTFMSSHQWAYCCLGDRFKGCLPIVRKTEAAVRLMYMPSFIYRDLEECMTPYLTLFWMSPQHTLSWNGLQECVTEML